MPKRMRDERIKTKATLIGRLGDWRDNASWREFFDLYWSVIYDLAVHSGLKRSEAEDVVQETMLIVARQIPTFKYDPSIGSFKGWLYNITRWRIADQFRKRGRITHASDSADTATGTRKLERIPDPASVEPDRTWEIEWEKNLLESAVAKVRRQLDPQKFQIFDFYVNKDWPAEKVAKTFGISTSQVYLAKNRTIELIKQEVARLRKEIT